MLLRLLRPSDPGVDQAPGHDEDRTQTDGYETAREASLEAFEKSWYRR
jgi:hypothetical protein